MSETVNIPWHPTVPGFSLQYSSMVCPLMQERHSAVLARQQAYAKYKEKQWFIGGNIASKCNFNSLVMFVCYYILWQPGVCGFDWQYCWTLCPNEHAIHSAVLARQHDLLSLSSV